MKTRQIAAVIFYNNKNQIFLQDRTGYKTLGEHYGFFGGGIEAGETPEQALVREIKEELNYEISNFQFIGIFSGRSGDLEVTMYTFIAKIDDTSKFKQTEGKGIKIVDIPTAKKMKLGGPWDYEALTKLDTVLK